MKTTSTRTFMDPNDEREMIKMNNIPLIKSLTKSKKFSWLHLLSLFTASSIAAITISLSAQAAETILFVAVGSVLTFPLVL